MQAIMEPIFEIAYLVFAIAAGIIMAVKAGASKALRVFGIAALLLGVGDSFHLIPRIYGLITGTMAENVFALGLGKLVTSITMTVFYVLIFHFLRLRFGAIGNRGLTLAVYCLAAARIILCLFPQNAWFTSNAALSWGIWRNIPFVLLGALIIVLFYKNRQGAFQLAWLAITLSFLFYIPVVLWADGMPLLGMLMLPKTACYVWLILMGYKEFKTFGKSEGNVVK
ncbi:MAG: hypothetical protein LBN26_06540 [Christensenellaceae bacterium]|jgi:hypothetical protein|nr:hypothetical protein [Christensenellaceae bacterium]